MKFMKLSSINIVGMSCLLLVGSFAQSATLYLCNASPFFMDTKVRFAGVAAAVTETKRTFEKDTPLDALLSPDSSVLDPKVREKYTTTRKTIAPAAAVDNTYALAPYSSVTIPMPDAAFTEGTGSITGFSKVKPAIITITATTVPTRTIVKDGQPQVVQVAQQKTIEKRFDQEKESVVFAIYTQQTQSYINDIQQVTGLDIFRMAGQDL